MISDKPRRRATGNLPENLGARMCSTFCTRPILTYTKQKFNTFGEAEDKAVGSQGLCLHG